LGGVFRMGEGIILIPLLILLFHFEQRKAQSACLIALVPATGLLALKLTPYRMRREFAVFHVLIGGWQIYRFWIS